jgi:hypothetical protein
VGGGCGHAASSDRQWPPAIDLRGGRGGLGGRGVGRGRVGCVGRVARARDRDAIRHKTTCAIRGQNPK